MFQCEILNKYICWLISKLIPRNIICNNYDNTLRNHAQRTRDVEEYVA